jgi:hypothetical protein
MYKCSEPEWQMSHTSVIIQKISKYIPHKYMFT